MLKTIDAGCNGRWLVTQNVPTVGKVVLEVQLAKRLKKSDSVGSGDTTAERVDLYFLIVDVTA